MRVSAGMRGGRDRGGIRHLRPLLDCPKAELWWISAAARDGGLSTDPSNTDDRFARARWRSLMPLLAAEASTPTVLPSLARRARQADEALDRKAAGGFRSRQSSTGRAKASPSTRQGLAAEPFEMPCGC